MALSKVMKIHRYARLPAAAVTLFAAVATLLPLVPAAEPTAPTSALIHLASRDLKIDHRYLNIPIKRGAPKQKVALLVDGVTIVVNEMEIADTSPDWWAFMDLKAWHGRTATVQVIGSLAASQLLSRVELANSIKGTEGLYQEALRPLIHFTSRRGWINDPNGLVYYNGEYHRFYQHNPYGWDWGNMHWGHSTSRDLVHWEEHGDVLMPDHQGAIASGSAVVDWENTSGFGRDGRPPLVLFYTASGKPFTQCIAYSTDGRTFTKYAGNPVIGEVTESTRDPKVFWHAPTKRWIMVIYSSARAGTGVMDADGTPALVHLIQFFTSPNLREWTASSTTAGGVGWENRFLYECPDLFELPVDGEPDAKMWVISGANGEYAIGSFDGVRFVPKTSQLRGNFGTAPLVPGKEFSAFYAAQSFSDAPDGRRIQIGWGIAKSPEMPFNMLHLLPTELGLRRTNEGFRLVRTPVKELANLRDGPDQSQALRKFDGEAVELRVEIEAGKTGVFEIDVRGVKIAYDTRIQELTVNGTKAAAPWVDGRQNIVVYVDRTVTEVFASDGLTYIATPFFPDAANRSISVHQGPGAAKLRSLQVYKLKSIWNVSER